MKRNLLALFAIAIAVVFSSFTVKTTTDYYLVYDQGAAGLETSVSSFDEPIDEAPLRQSGEGRINWIKVVDSDNDFDIDQSEFNTAFALYNQVDPTSNLLSDESDSSGLDVME